jgi:Kelch motif/Galactose oxidase, central domain
LIQNGGAGQQVPPARTNHTVISWQDKLYLFGGTDGNTWFNDVWTYDPSTNLWTEQDCIGYIPAPREGHAAALINDTMYIFGGRIQEGTDLGDLVAFKITTKRWYMFQNMGMSPSPRSGHSMTAFGHHIIVLAGEPSSAPREPTELSLAYVLDTTKIRYPSDPTPSLGSAQHTPTQSFGDRSMVPKPSGIPMLSQPTSRPESPMTNGVQARLLKPSGNSPPGTSPQGSQSQLVQPRSMSESKAVPLRTTAPSRSGAQSSQDRNTMSPTGRDTVQSEVKPPNGIYGAQSSVLANVAKAPSTNPSRSGSRLARQQASIDSDSRDTPRASVDTPATTYSSREVSEPPIDSAIGVSPPLGHQNEELVKDLEALKNRNVWYASELALARKAGYQPSSSANSILDQQSADAFGEDDRPMIEAMLRLKSELVRLQSSIDTKSDATAIGIAEMEKQRDTALSEAAYYRAKLAAVGGPTNGSQVGSPQPDAGRGSATSPDIDRANEMSRRLVVALTSQKELSARMEHLNAEIEAERRAREIAEDTAEAAEKRAAELDSYKQRSTAEMEMMRSELYEAKRTARDESSRAAEASSARMLLEADKNELSAKHGRILEDSKGHTMMLQSLKDAVTASMEKTDHLEKKLGEERSIRQNAEQTLGQIQSEHEQRGRDVESLKRQLKDAQDLAERHAQEARTHRDAVLSGLGAATSRSLDDMHPADEKVEVLTKQLDAANAMSRQNKEAADTAADRLRRAEERIAGLEAYQEQISRENLTIRKQAQLAIKELQTMQADKAEMQLRLDRSLLDSNALEVQLKTLKNLLEERGINAVDARRSRVLESPGSRYGTPDLSRMRELERQLDDSHKANDEIRQVYEHREHDTAKEWEEKLQILTNDHQESIKYVKALEKFLAKMKSELQRSKSVNNELEKKLSEASASTSRDLAAGGASREWESERDQLHSRISDMQTSTQTAVAALESQVVTLKSSLAEAAAERESLQNFLQNHEAEMQKNRSETDALKREKSMLETRVADSDRRLKLFLGQFDNSVDNFKRMSRMEHQPLRIGGDHHQGHVPRTSDPESIYSTTSADDEYDEDDQDTETEGDQKRKKKVDRTSSALDTFTTELDVLRSRWESATKNYKVNDYDSKSQTTSPGVGSSTHQTLSSWARGLDVDDDDSLKSEEEQFAMRTGKFGPTSTPGAANVVTK